MMSLSWRLVLFGRPGRGALVPAELIHEFAPERLLRPHPVVHPAQEPDVPDRRFPSQRIGKNVVELELMSRSAELAVPHLPDAAGSIALPHLPLHCVGRFAALGRPGWLLTWSFCLRLSLPVALENELEARANHPRESTVRNLVRERRANLLQFPDEVS